MTQKKVYIIIGLLLLAGAGIAATLSYDSDGNYVGLPDLSTLFSQSENTYTDTVAPPYIGTQPSSGSLALLNGTALIPVPLTPPDNETGDAPETLGTVYAVDYRTSPPHGSAPMLVRFVAEDNAPTTPCHWTFGDGHSSTELDHFHTYKQPGTYTVTLTRGQYAANITFTVEPPGVVPLPESEEMMF